jgi:hypothetical protein
MTAGTEGYTLCCVGNVGLERVVGDGCASCPARGWWSAMVVVLVVDA